MAVPDEKIRCYLFGAGVGVCAGALDLVPCKTDPLELCPRDARMDSEMDVSMKTTTAMLVAFANADCAPRGPKVLVLPPPPNAPARSALLPLCTRTTMIKKMETMMWIVSRK